MRREACWLGLFLVLIMPRPKFRGANQFTSTKDKQLIPVVSVSSAVAAYADNALAAESFGSPLMECEHEDEPVDSDHDEQQSEKDSFEDSDEGDAYHGRRSLRAFCENRSQRTMLDFFTRKGELTLLTWACISFTAGNQVCCCAHRCVCYS